MGKKILQKEMLRLNKMVKEKEEKVKTVQKELEGVMEAMEAVIKVEDELKAENEQLKAAKGSGAEDVAELKEEVRVCLVRSVFLMCQSPNPLVASLVAAGTGDRRGR